MKIKSFNVKMLGALVPVALAFASCSEEKVVVEDPVNPPADQPSQTVPTDVVPAQTFTDVTFPKAAFGGTVTSRASRADAGKVLSTVLEVSSPVEGESATSVFVAEDGTYYVSYQTQGDNVGGGIQTINGEEVAFYQTVGDNKAFDFNSLYFDGTQVLAVGHYETASQDGAAVVGFLENNGSSLQLSYKPVTTAEGIYREFVNPDNENGNATYQKVDYVGAGDANSIVKLDDANYVVATRKGLALLDSELSRTYDADSTKVRFVFTPGSAKYVVKTDNGLTALYLNGTSPYLYDFTSIGDSVEVSGATQIAGATLETTLGKNMLAYDNGTGTIYACLGEAGLLVGNDLLTEPFKGSSSRQLPVAGVAVDDDYIYVADGTYLVIINKADSSDVTKWNLRTKDAEGNTVFEDGSINFVVVGTPAADGTRQLVVACGKAGVKVLSFNPAGAAEEEAE